MAVKHTKGAVILLPQFQNHKSRPCDSSVSPHPACWLLCARVHIKPSFCLCRGVHVAYDITQVRRNSFCSDDACRLWNQTLRWCMRVLWTGQVVNMALPWDGAGSAATLLPLVCWRDKILEWQTPRKWPLVLPKSFPYPAWWRLIFTPAHFQVAAAGEWPPLSLGLTPDWTMKHVSLWSFRPTDSTCCHRLRSGLCCTLMNSDNMQCNLEFGHIDPHMTSRIKKRKTIVPLLFLPVANKGRRLHQ